MSDNELIANLMGWVWPKDPDHKRYEITSLKYHESWAWLMPVVEKITGIPYESEEVDNGFGVKVTVVQRPYLRTFGMINDENGHYMARFNRCALHMAPTLIEATYSAVVEFIKLYNLPSSEEEAREWDFHQKLP